MATTSTSTAAAAAEPVFTDAEQLALAGFLACYTSLTREAYALDLRQYASLVPAASPAPVPGAAPTSNASPATWKPAAGRGRLSRAACALSLGSISTP